MAFSELAHKITIKKLEQKHEIEKLKIVHEQELKQLLSQCNHRYDNGISAKTYHGMQWDNWEECEICNKKV